LTGLLFWLLATGCSPSARSRADDEEAYHPGPKLNIPDFIKNTAAYKGKVITLLLKIDEAAPQGQGQTLQAFVGRDVKFRTAEPKGEQLHLVITIPKDLPVPDASPSDELSVRFACTRGNLRQGNEAKSIEKR